MRVPLKTAVLSSFLLAITMPAQAQTITGKAAGELNKIVSASGAPRSFKFCDADKSSGKCKSAKGLRAIGLGGAFIPLGLEVKGFKVTGKTKNAAGTLLTTKFDTVVNGIAPKCKDTSLKVPANARKLEFKGFYCNWLAIGNVVARVTLDVDKVNVKRKSFSGSYTLRLVGTGNMFGKGKFVAQGR